MDVEGSGAAVVESYQYLGIPIVPSVDCCEMVADRARRAMRAVHGIQHCLQWQSVPIAV